MHADNASTRHRERLQEAEAWDARAAALLDSLLAEEAASDEAPAAAAAAAADSQQPAASEAAHAQSDSRPAASEGGGATENGVLSMEVTLAPADTAQPQQPQQQPYAPIPLADLEVTMAASLQAMPDVVVVGPC